MYLWQEKDTLSTVRDKDIVRNVVVLKTDAGIGDRIGQDLHSIPTLEDEASDRIVQQLGDFDTAI